MKQLDDKIREAIWRRAHAERGSPAEEAALDEALLRDPAVRQALREAQITHRILATHLPPAPDLEDRLMAELERDLPGLLEEPRTEGLVLRRLLPWLGLAAAVLLGFLMVQSWSGSRHLRWETSQVLATTLKGSETLPDTWSPSALRAMCDQLQAAIEAAHRAGAGPESEAWTLGITAQVSPDGARVFTVVARSRERERAPEEWTLVVQDTDGDEVAAANAGFAQTIAERLLRRPVASDRP